MDNTNDQKKVIRSLMEQGDLGLFGEPLSEEDQKAFMEQKVSDNDTDKNK